MSWVFLGYVFWREWNSSRVPQFTPSNSFIIWLLSRFSDKPSESSVSRGDDSTELRPNRIPISSELLSPSTGVAWSDSDVCAIEGDKDTIVTPFSFKDGISELSKENVDWQEDDFLNVISRSEGIYVLKTHEEYLIELVMTCILRKHDETTLWNHLCCTGFQNTPIIESRVLKWLEWDRWNQTMSIMKLPNCLYRLSGDIINWCRVMIRGAKTSLATSLKEKEEE